MASVNKQSLREEFDTLKARFERLCADGQMAAESRALFQAMLMLFEVLMAVFMERHTTKDNSNSSKPSSQTPKDDTAITRAGANGKGKAHNEARCANTRTVETVQVAEVNECESCAEDLSNTAPVGHERRTRIDIIFEKVVSHVDAQIKSCPQCGAQTKGQFPADMPGPLQYGPGIKAYVLNLADRPDDLPEAGATIDQDADRHGDLGDDDPEVRDATASGLGGLGAIGH